MNDKKLTKKELDFCRWYVKLRNPRESAIKAGFDLLPEHKAIYLLGKNEIREKIKEMETFNKADSDLISAGLCRLAFGSIADSVKLLLSCKEDEIPPVDSLDLFNISEIKFTYGKGMEIKFFDRLKALEALKEMQGENSENSSLSFFEALNSSVSEGDLKNGEYWI